MFGLSDPVTAAIGWVLVVGGLGGLLTWITPWYRALSVPAWKPPDWSFAPIWTIILVLSAYAGVRAWGAATTAEQYQDIITVFVVNGLFNLLWSPIFFVMRRPDLALVEVWFLIASVIAMIWVLAPVDGLAAMLILPYLLWVLVAARLNETIVELNPGNLPGGDAAWKLTRVGAARQMARSHG